MAIKHKIRKNGEGETYIANLTPMKAIRKNCLECVGFSSEEVKACSSPLCPLYPFRFGVRP